MGQRHAKVVDALRRTITVVGRDHSGRDRVASADARGCPLMRL